MLVQNVEVTKNRASSVPCSFHEGWVSQGATTVFSPDEFGMTVATVADPPVAVVHEPAEKVVADSNVKVLLQALTLEPEI